MIQTSRRDFAKGAMGLFGWGMFAGGLGGCSVFSEGSGPRLAIGIMSDIHIQLVRKDGKDAFNGAERFRKALEWLRDQGVDGVTISGDLADHGLVEELEEVGRIWRSVFPGDKAPDGRHVERLFVYGNHDWEGFNYGSAGKKIFGEDYAAHTIRADLAAAWKKAFGEEYSPVWRKEVKGYTFVGAHWIADHCRAFNEIGVPQTPEWFKENGQTIDPSKPFFYLQHPPPKNTCHGSWLWGHDDGRLTETLSHYRNAIAITSATQDLNTAISSRIGARTTTTTAMPRRRMRRRSCAGCPRETGIREWSRECTATASCSSGTTSKAGSGLATTGSCRFRRRNRCRSRSSRARRQASPRSSRLVPRLQSA